MCLDFENQLAISSLFFLSLSGTKIDDQITGVALVSFLAKAEKLATLR